ncbi:MAG: undecaprenyl/decaprenyl-phosphate alpha-N-acetylglucosaminyl 1-phosphate transferase [Candidatus Latescibacteria bacterium]|nr:undecaprenyl/decaprenyl-phosphate alpha-N-acetylglucosaminyl 1-phosphate transferase [Candidatus Latescibacterota bacterium]
MSLISEWIGLPWYMLLPLVLLLGWVAQELSRSVATSIGLLDLPNPRKIHLQPVPLSGGPGLFVPLLLGYLVWLAAGSPGQAMGAALSLGLAFTLIFTTGLVDDLRGLSARRRLVIQATAGLLLWAGGFRLDAIAFGGWTLQLGLFSLPLTLLWFMGFMNTSNLMDGMDGLSGGMNLLALLALGTFGLFIGSGVGALAMFAAGLVVPYLVCNLRGRGKVFLGDSGSLSLGLTVGTFALAMARQPGAALSWAPLAFALAAYVVGILDVLTSIVRRRRDGVSPFRPDTHHFHHRLLRAGLGPKWTLASLHGLSGLAVFAVALPFYGAAPLALVHLVLPMTVCIIAATRLVRFQPAPSKVIPLHSHNAVKAAAGGGGSSIRSITPVPGSEGQAANMEPASAVEPLNAINR